MRRNEAARFFWLGGPARSSSATDTLEPGRMRPVGSTHLPLTDLTQPCP